jgi:hypothetical protein
LTIANIMTPTPSRPQTARLDQRMSPQSLPASNQPGEQQAPKAPVPYVAASQAAAITAAAQSPTQAQAKTQTGTSAPQVQPAPQEQTAATDDASTKAREAELKRQADKRKAQWAGRRKYDQQREQELRDAQARMQDDDAPRDVVIRRDWRDERNDYGRPEGMPFPRLSLFGSED